MRSARMFHSQRLYAHSGIAIREYPASFFGFMLVEVLISVLLFALACVALMSMQTRSLGGTGQSQYRAEAIQLANAYVARMWAHRGTGSELIDLFQSKSGKEYVALEEEVKRLLPRALSPVVVISDNGYALKAVNGNTYNLSGVDVRITLSWQESTPTGETETHNYTQATAIGFPILDSDN